MSTILMSKLIISICDFLTFHTQVLHNLLDNALDNVLHQILHKTYLRKTIWSCDRNAFEKSLWNVCRRCSVL